MPVQSKLSLKVAMELLEFFSQNVILISVPTYELQSVKKIYYVYSLRKSHDSQRHDDVISIHSKWHID